MFVFIMEFVLVAGVNQEKIILPIVLVLVNIGFIKPYIDCKRYEED